jgi:hypothetical protein
VTIFLGCGEMGLFEGSDKAFQVFDFRLTVESQHRRLGSILILLRDLCVDIYILVA